MAERALVEFAPYLQKFDGAAPVSREGLPRDATAVFGMPDDIIESLIVFEGALAWETGQPRDAVRTMARPWARRAWLAGWDWAEAGLGARVGAEDPAIAG